jgi:cell division protein FtsL
MKTTSTTTKQSTFTKADKLNFVILVAFVVTVVLSVVFNIINSGIHCSI